ncbi:MAG: hypothetical protein AB7O59_13650 [Pirellulales bacterium]
MVRHTILAALFLTLIVANARAADADPSGDWTFEMMRQGQVTEVPMTLKADGEKLTGTVGRDERKADIEEGSFKDGEVAFKVTRERNGQTFTVSYKGKLEGDTIKGTVEFNAGGESRSRDWEAKRAK